MVSATIIRTTLLRINNWRLWLGLGASTFFLVILALSVDPEEIATALGQANYIYVVPAIGLYFIAVYFRSVRWQFLLSTLTSLPVSRLYPVVVIGYMANNLLPARLGELVRSYYLAQRERVSGSSALATIAIERVYDGVALLAFAALSGPLLLLLGQFDSASDTYRATAIAVTGGVVAVFLMALTVLTLATRPWFTHILDLALKVVPSPFRGKARDLSLRFVLGLAILNSPRKHAAVFLLSMPVWLMEGATYLLVSYSFGIHTFFDSFWILLLVMLLLTATSNLATALPASIGGIGPFEVVAQQTLVALGVGASVAAVYSGFLHVVALWLPVNLVGLVLLWKHNLSLKQLADVPEPSGAGPSQGYQGISRPNEEAS
jgi:uncharacterized protein (TIRG00374 family)